MMNSRKDAHARKGYVVLTRMKSITTYTNQRGQPRSGKLFMSFKLSLAFAIMHKILDRWDLEDTPETEEKVLKIVRERYRGWRSTASSTYKAYKTDAARLANLPEDLQSEEWEGMIDYFVTDS
ncbi:hypothetical protein VPH35_134202 [Triticum aestivum]